MLRKAILRKLVSIANRVLSQGFITKIVPDESCVWSSKSNYQLQKQFDIEVLPFGIGQGWLVFGNQFMVVRSNLILVSNWQELKIDLSKRHLSFKNLIPTQAPGFCTPCFGQRPIRTKGSVGLGFP
jgi:hypothetical protein